MTAALRAGCVSLTIIFCLRSISAWSADTTIIHSSISSGSIITAPAGAPVINSFYPVSGAPGTVVTITGTNFNPVASINVVFFGAVRATVAASSGKSLSVTVPLGATADIITVINLSSQLTGTSSQNFLPVFSGTATAKSTIIPGSTLTFSRPSAPMSVTSADMDGDGKPDLIMTLRAAGDGGSIVIVRNTSSPGNMSENTLSPGDYLFQGGQMSQLAVADMDGDGKPDIISEDVNGDSIYIWKNVSSPGTLAFTKAASLRPQGYALTVADIDGDGKPDILAIYGMSLQVLKNNTVGTLTNESFSPSVSFEAGNDVEHLLVRDLDGDGKPEVITCDAGDNVISVYHNTTVTGIINPQSFASRVAFFAGKGAFMAKVADMDGDGKPDLIIADRDSTSIAILKNVSANGIFNAGSLAPAVIFGASSRMESVDVGDLDGDGKPDIVACGIDSGIVSIYKNTTLTGIIDPSTLAFRTDFYTANQNNYSPGVADALAIDDLDGDGKPDVAIVSNFTNSIAIVQPAANLTPPKIYSFSPDTAGTHYAVSIAGVHLLGTSAVTFGGLSASAFKVISDSLITALVGAGATGYIAIKNSLAPDSVAGFHYVHGPVINSFLPLLAGEYDTVSINGHYFTDCTYVGFGSLPATSFAVMNDSLIRASVPTGESGLITVNTPFGVATSPGFVFVKDGYIQFFTPAVGGPGDTIYVHGSNLNTTQTVWFGGTPAAGFTIISDTMVLVRVGNGKNGDVTLDNIGNVSSKPGFTFGIAPVISSFSPAYGPPGTTVVIRGVRFGQSNGENIVHFGAAKATVTAANENSMSVVVPNGATEWPLTVTVKNQTAAARVAFVPTFSGTDTGLAADAFAADVSFPTGVGSNSLALADLDNDGKIDLTVGYNYGNPPSLGVFQNISSSASIQFKTNGEYNSLPNDVALSVAPVDMDGDGALDIASNSGPIISGGMYRNISTPGNALLAPDQPVNFGNLSGPHIACGDLDGDGRPDYILDSYPAAFQVFRNISSDSIIQYDLAGQTNLPSGLANDIAVSDLDGDGKPDLAVIGYSVLWIYLNTSKIGTISFGAPIAVPIAPGGSNDYRIVSADLNQDGKPDIILLAGGTSDFLSVFQNISTPGNIGFNTRRDITTGDYAISFTVADVSGDGKPDIELLDSNQFLLSVYQNISTATKIDFRNPKKYLLHYQARDIKVGDVDNDGRPDIVTINNGGVSILKNQIPKALIPVITFFTPTTGKSGDIIFIHGKNLATTVSVKFGSTLADSFIVVKDTLVEAYVGKGATGTVELTNAAGIADLAGFSYLGVKINSFSPDSLSAGQSMTIRGTGLAVVNAVTLGNISGSSVTHQGDTLLFVVVGIVKSGYVTVRSMSDQDSLPGFVYLPPHPRITSFTPDSGLAGTTVRITGFHLAATLGVYFGGTPATRFSEVSDSVVLAVVGNGSSGFVRLETNDGIDSIGTFQLLVPPPPGPLIRSFTPTSGTVYDNIIISGNHFTSVDTVLFGGTAAVSFTVTTDSTISAVVANGHSGDVTVITPTGRASLGGFTYFGAPAIFGFSPNSGTTGDTIRIRGIYFSGVTSAWFADQSASFIVNADTLITAIVGAGATGDVRLSGPYGYADVPGFTFLEKVPVHQVPVITRFSPTTATANDTVVIYGSNLSGVNSVSFGQDQAASMVIMGDSIIKAVLGYLGGSGDVAVYDNFGDKSSLPGFTYIPPPIPTPVIISSFSPTAGTEGTLIHIYGSGFAGAYRVVFGMIDAGSYRVISDSLIDAVVGKGRTGFVDVFTSTGYDSVGGFTYIDRRKDSVSISSFSPGSGTTGTTITLRGTDFTGATQVTFGTVPAAVFSVVSDSIIMAVVGSGASGEIVVSTANQSAVALGFVYVSPKPVLPKLSGFSPAAAAKGQSVSISGNHLLSISGITFGGVAAQSFIITSDSSINAVVADGSSGIITVFSANGEASIDGFTFIRDSSAANFSLLQFNGFTQNNATQLQWQTANDSTIASYDVERSRDSVSFNSLTVISSQQSTGPNNYSFTDTLPRFSSNYYRLQITDLFGNITYSKIIVVDEAKAIIKIYPNPGHGYITIQHPASFGAAVINLYDYMGKKVATYPVLPNTLQTSIDVSGILPGLYQLTWTDGNQSLSQAIIIQ